MKTLCLLLVVVAVAAEEIPPGVVPVPAAVRRDLGITFAPAAYRHVTATVRIPGHLEVAPQSELTLSAPVEGRVTLHLDELDTVAAGIPVADIDSPTWRSLQSDLRAARSAIPAAEAALGQVRARHQAALNLAGRVGEALEAELRAAESAVAAAQATREGLLARAASLLGRSAEDLATEVDGRPRYESIDRVPLISPAGGLVLRLATADGAWVAAGDQLAILRQGSGLRFHGKALQADGLDRLREGQALTLVPPDGPGRLDLAAPRSILRLGHEGDAVTRTIAVYADVAEPPPWMRPGLAVFADVVTAGNPDDEDLAIPLRAVIRDGLERVFFRRDPNNPDRVIRTVADLGVDDGRHVVVRSGLGEGDEVVVDGVFQLKLATSGQTQKAGHFHADGTWHEGDH